MFMIFSALAPIFLIILAGFAVERLAILPASTGKILSAFSVTICIPCLFFHIMAGTEPAQLAQGRWWLGMLGVQMGCLFLFYQLERRLRRAEKGPAIISSLSCCFCNAGFVGVAVILNLFPDDAKAMTAAGVTVIAANVIAIVGQMLLMAREGGGQEQAEPGMLPAPLARAVFLVRRFILGNPILMASALGLSVPLLGLPLWPPLDRACALLGLVSPTCMLFTIGFCLRENLAEAKAALRLEMGHLFFVWAMRLVVVPLLTLAALLILDCDPLWTSVAVIIMATGTAVLVSAFAQVYQVQAAQAALTVAVTNMLCLFSLMGAIWLLTALELMPKTAF